MAKLSKLLQFGDCSFTVKSGNAQLVATIETMFPGASRETLLNRLEMDIDQEVGDGGSLPEFERALIPSLLNRLYARHSRCLWISSASLCAPNGELVLLSGPSYSGKTTLALAMALTRGWKIISQDITLIDPSSNLVLPCPAPINLRQGARELLSGICNLSQATLGWHGWFFDPALYLTQPMLAKFQAALILMPFNQSGEDTNGSFSMEQMVYPEEYVREILPWSNLLRYADRISVLQKAIEGSRCIALEGGSLSQRIDLLESVV